jgi:hypothetical protein
MKALANRKAALLGTLATKSDAELDELKQLIALTQQKLDTNHSPTHDPIGKLSTSPTLPNPAEPVPRVPETSIQPVPRVQRNTTAHLTITPTAQRTSRRRCQLLHHAATPINLPNQPAALSTRSRVRASQQAIAVPTSSAPPRASRIPKPKLKPPVLPRRSSRCPQANVVTAFHDGNYHKAFKQLEKQVHQALAVLDEEYGKTT